MPNATSITESWTCQHCGATCRRPATRGQRPKWCSQKCSDLGKKAHPRTCEQCGNDYTGRGERYCSPQCHGVARRIPRIVPSPRTPEELAATWAAMRSPLRAAIEDRDVGALIPALLAKVSRTVDGCWEWQGRIDRSGYPTMAIGHKRVGVHRVVLEVVRGASLGVQHAHHTCANRVCVNPSHLTPATQAENSAEMKARTSYVARIRELEAALREVAPDHEALAVLPFV